MAWLPLLVLQHPGLNLVWVSAAAVVLVVVGVASAVPVPIVLLISLLGLSHSMHCMDASSEALCSLQTEASSAFMATAVIPRGKCLGQAMVVAVTAKRAHIVRRLSSSSAYCADVT